MMIAKIGRTLPSLLALLGLLSLASTARAQGNTFNPYGNSGYADYREFGNAMVSNNPALPGQSLLNSTPAITRQRANSYQQYSNELEGVAASDTTPNRRGTNSNVPYYQAYQRLNSQYNRVYQANNTDEDRAFYERQKQRDLAYSKALKETDPAKRAKLLRQVEQDSLDRPTGTTRTTTAKATIAPKPGATTSTPSARSSAPAERRQPAPSPFGTDVIRRPSTTGSRVPSPSPTGPAPTLPSSRSAGATSRRAPDPSTIPIPPPR